MSSKSLPLVAAAGVALITGILATAAVAIDEDNTRTDEAVALACGVIASTIIDGRHKHQQSAIGPADVGLLAKRQFIFWDQESMTTWVPTLPLVLMNLRESLEFLGQHMTAFIITCPKLTPFSEMVGR
jgi:hypothetical protein